jgi:hypothetical protein
VPVLLSVGASQRGFDDRDRVVGDQR